MQENDRNYVAAWNDWAQDKIVVLERDQEGKLYKKLYNPPYYFYVPDDDGEYTSIFGDKLIRAEFDNKDHFEAAKRAFPRKFESDISPLKRVLMDYYYNRPAPFLHFAFFDIETNYSRSLGFSGPKNPYAEINAITVYQSWTGKYLTAAIPPPIDTPSGKVRWDKLPENDVHQIELKIHELIAAKNLREGIIPEIHLVEDEYALLALMLEWLNEADIISGWNSEFYDIPYICERLKLAGGDSMLARLEHPGAKLPKKEMMNHFGEEEPIYTFSGRCHLDYMALFKKFTFEGRTSYSLGNILQEEVGVGKLEYEGTLEQLYHNDFPTFVGYNFRDVDGLVQLDEKFKFIALANQMAHENTVRFGDVLGTVSYVETGIANHAHYELNKIVHDKIIMEHDRVEGAIVLTPKIGMHEWIGSVDISSLYPNTIRSLNISPEKIIGQFEAKEEAWSEIRKSSEKRLCMTFESGEQQIAAAAEWKKLLSDNKWAISAYGTVFDQSNGCGVVADILGYWYSERKRLQAEQDKWAKIMQEHPAGPEKDAAAKKEEQFDLLQLTKKISMNSLYGALLNSYFRFGDERMGASVTATGRQITTHMVETIGEFLTGIHSPLIKTRTLDEEGQFINEYHSESEVIIYSDTDSGYFKCLGATNKNDAVEIADLTAHTVNSSFPAFMREAFNCQNEFDNLITAVREIVGIRGLFQAKKKYMIKVVDMKGKSVDKLKSMGSEIKKADTPKLIQKFLKTMVDMILDGQSYEDVCTYVNEQRRTILKNKNNVFLLGGAVQVNNLDKYLAEYVNPGTQRSDSGGKLTIPGHARAACNYNTLLDQFDKGAKSIRSGDKILLFYLKPNQFKFKSIAFPAELSKFPPWFNENFQVDIKLTEEKMFDSKMQGIFSALKKDVPSLQSVLINRLVEF